MIQRISKDKKQAYNSIVKDLKEQVDVTLKKAKKFEREAGASRTMENSYKKIASASIYLDTIDMYCKMNEYSVEIMGLKSDSHLTNARKSIYQAIRLLESIVGDEIDAPLNENQDILEKLEILTPPRLLHLLKKIEYSIIYVEHEEGDNSKWKWNFVEMYGKFAALCKNLVLFKKYVMIMNDPRVPYYQEANDLVQMVKVTLNNAAQKMRTKYEMSSREVNDMNKAINFLKALVRIHVILNENEFAQEAKKITEKWKEKLELDIKAKEEERKKAKTARNKKRR